MWSSTRTDIPAKNETESKWKEPERSFTRKKTSCSNFIFEGFEDFSKSHVVLVDLLVLLSHFLKVSI